MPCDCPILLSLDSEFNTQPLFCLSHFRSASTHSALQMPLDLSIASQVQWHVRRGSLQSLRKRVMLPQSTQRMIVLLATAEVLHASGCITRSCLQISGYISAPSGQPSL
jgi:hypothetical protein